MSTIPDVTLVTNTYTNLYAGAGIVVGSSVTVQNKTSNAVYLQNIAEQPSASSPAGFVLLPNEFISVTGTVLGLWAKGTGKVAVEVIT